MAYDEKLLDEIKRRTQGSNVSMGVYFAIMINLFKRLLISLRQITKLKMIAHNIVPYLPNQLGLVEFKTLQELRTI